MEHSTLSKNTSNRAPDVIYQTLDCIDDLSQVENNWDGCGALAPTKKAIGGAVQLINELFEEKTPVPNVFPVPNGNLQLEWSCFDFEIELEINSYSKCFAFVEDLRSGGEWEKEYNYDLTELRSLISSLTERSKKSPRLTVVE
jgi:hypothetical protein